MNTKERLFWMASVILIILFAQQKSQKAENLEVIITSFQLEESIKQSQLLDLSNQIIKSRDDGYRNGFEAGKTQASVVLMNKDSLYNYTDGYHAAVSQFGTVGDHKLSQDFLLNLLLDTIDTEIETEEAYLEIISDLISEEDINN